MGEGARRRREFIKAHHPDLGGDPEIFLSGLQALDAEFVATAATGPPPKVTAVQRVWPVKLAAWALRPLRRGSKRPRVS